MEKISMKQQFSNCEDLANCEAANLMIIKTNNSSSAKKKKSNDRVKNAFKQFIEEIKLKHLLDKQYAEDLMFIIDDYIDNNVSSTCHF